MCSEMAPQSECSAAFYGAADVGGAGICVTVLAFRAEGEELLLALAFSFLTQIME